VLTPAATLERIAPRSANTANDVLANLGVVGAGALVAVTDSRYRDLVIGTVIAIVVLLGARRILRLR
jgi:Co/Zn/Cd efflux system component